MNNNPSNPHASFSDDSSVTFLIRWRGRQEGPYTAAVIEAKLAANQIGLLHEIFHNGQWVTLRDYLAEREAILRAERQAREEQERRAREEAERQAREREEQRRAEALAEERRKAAQVETDNFRQQQAGAIHSPPSQPSGGSSGLRTVGILLLLGGLAIAAYFFLVFDTSVTSGMGRVNNLGLMADRQNGILIGIGMSIVGAIIFMVGTRGNKTAIQQRPPHASQIVSPLPTAERPAPQSNALKEKILPKEDGFNPKLVKSFRIQCRCKHCSGILEFVDINAGKGALCPHCGKETVLFIPAGAQCTCNNCAAELDFDVSDAGATIQCPICSKETVLLVPGGSRMKPVSTVSGTPSLWNPNAAANWSLIFTPAFSAFLHAQNADVLGRVKEAKANRIWLYASLVFLGLVTVSCFFPQLPDGVVSLGGLVLLFGWYLSLGRKQIKFVQETWQNRYHKKSWTNPLLIAFGSLCGFVILAMFLRAYP